MGHLWWKNYSSPEIDEQRERKTTNLVTNVLATLQKQTNKPIEVASTTPDNDFCTLYKASRFMSGPGGFSEAISGARNHHYGESPWLVEGQMQLMLAVFPEREQRALLQLSTRHNQKLERYVWD